MHESTPASRPMRADAQRNYASLLKAARVAVSERGADIVLEDIARSAGVAFRRLDELASSPDGLRGSRAEHGSSRHGCQARSGNENL